MTIFQCELLLYYKHKVYTIRLIYIQSTVYCVMKSLIYFNTNQICNILDREYY